MQSYKICLFLIKNDIFVCVNKLGIMNKSLYALFLLITIMFVSCETDIDVNAEYKDIPVVYGLIDAQDSVHYIKITKAFLENGNALDLAAAASNFNYAAGDLEVIVEELDNGRKIQTHSLTRTVNEIAKDPGVFDDGENVLYKFTDKSINKYRKAFPFGIT